MIKSDFKLISIQDIPIDFSKIPGLDTEQIDYVSSIGGANAPEEGATAGATWNVNVSDQPVVALGDANGNLIKEVINNQFNTSTKQILSDFTFGVSGAIKMITDANNGLWISPTGILGKKAGVTTFAVDTSGNASFRGSVVITGGSGLASLSDAGSLATKDSIGTSDCDSTIISGGKIVTGLLTADNIQTGSLTGRVVQTASSGERIRLDGSNGDLLFYNSSGTQIGKIDIDGTNYFRIETSQSSPYGMVLGANNNAVVIVSTVGVTLQGSYVLSSNEVKSNYLTGRSGDGVVTLRMESTSSPLTDNGSIYFNGSHFYGRIAGVWKQLDN